MKTVRLEMTEDDLATLFGALVEQYNRLIVERKDPARQHVAQIIDRKITRCLNAQVKVERKIQKMYV